MKVDGKTLTLSSGLWVQLGDVEVREKGGERHIAGRDDESYVKVLNHFGRVLKLYTFEGGRWVDADTGSAPQPFDETQAGRLPGVAAAGVVVAGGAATKTRASAPGKKATAQKRAAKPAPASGRKPAASKAAKVAKSTKGRGKAVATPVRAAKAGGKAGAKSTRRPKRAGTRG